jgi:hypothetical protein
MSSAIFGCGAGGVRRMSIACVAAPARPIRVWGAMEQLSEESHKAEDFLVSDRGRRGVTEADQDQSASGNQKTICAKPLRKR